MEADDSEEVGGPTSGPIADGAGFHAKTYPVYQAHQCRRQCLAPHLSAATVMTAAYWMFQVYQVLNWKPQPAAGQCVTEHWQVPDSSQGCQDCPSGVQRVQAAEDQEAGPVGAPGQWPVRPASGISPQKDILEYP
jgi:hypothetical protein